MWGVWKGRCVADDGNVEDVWVNGRTDEWTNERVDV